MRLSTDWTAIGKRIGLGIAFGFVCGAMGFYIGPKWGGKAPLPSIEQAQVKVAASVAGRTITFEELDKPIAARVFDLENRIYYLRKQRLDQMVAQTILEKIASENSTTVQKLINDILGKGVQVDPEEIDKYYEDNPQIRTSWKGSQEELKKKITDGIAQQKGMQQVKDYALSSGPKYGLDIQVKPPEPPVVKVDIGADPILGPADAKVTIIEFSDYQCPACRKTHSAVKEIRSRYPNLVKWVFKDYPMKNNSGAAAEAARCAGEQGRFWEYQDLLFSTKNGLDEARLISCARELGLETSMFSQCLSTHKYELQVRNNLEEASRIGVNATPTYIINGKMIAGGPPLEEFVKMIFQESAGTETGNQKIVKK